MSSRPAPGPPNFDRLAAFPELAALRDAVSARDWTSVELFFAGLPDAAAVSYVVGYASDLPGSEQCYDRAPDSSLSSLLRAARYVALAWEVRSGARAEYVSEDQFRGMHDWLRRAEPILIDLTAREPDNAPAWSVRLTTALGLQLGQHEARRRYDRLARHAPHHFQAQSRLLQQFCPKWGGTWDRAFGFARECAANAPAGSTSPTLIPEVHLEQYIDLDTARERADYLRRPEVRAEVLDAARRSVLHPDFGRGYGWVGAASTFALVLGITGSEEAAARCFDMLGDLANEHPWHYFEDAAAKYRKVRASVQGRPQS
ncbi:hypothetical protein BC739_003194 [Kutzneria viridogrisea]|uniref:DUF4034 domain-containing protein n=1 Tax=Kutzneria viridogrisea TaxID=47990 RepID=A0ABR6BGU9_9PSEU|nr:hypothetical protein [Kutzneria viridogrisea]